MTQARPSASAQFAIPPASWCSSTPSLWQTTGDLIAQWPNTALLVSLVASMARALFDLGGGWGTALRVVAALALGWWAVDEIARGVNPWRRMLGAVVLAGLVAPLI